MNSVKCLCGRGSTSTFLCKDCGAKYRDVEDKPEICSYCQGEVRPICILCAIEIKEKREDDLTASFVADQHDLFKVYKIAVELEDVIRHGED